MYRAEADPGNSDAGVAGGRPVVVSGAAGFIGSHLVDALLAAGYRVVAVDDMSPFYDPARKRANLAVARRHPRCRVVEGDLAAGGLRDLLAEASVVFHLAARPGVQDSWGDGFADACRRNIELTQRVFEAALAGGIDRVVFASSSSVYGDGGTGPISPYGVTKLAGEQLAQVYRARGLVVTCLRYFTVYGPRQRPDMALHRLFEAALGRGPGFALRGEGRQRRELTFVSDVVRATMAAGFVPAAADRTLDVGGGSSVSLVELLDRVAAVTGRPVPTYAVAAAAGDPSATVADLGPAAEVLGWVPQVDLDRGLRAQWAWHRQTWGASAGTADGSEAAVGTADGSEAAVGAVDGSEAALARQARTAAVASTTSHRPVSP